MINFILIFNYEKSKLIYGFFYSNDVNFQLINLDGFGH